MQCNPLRLSTLNLRFYGWLMLPITIAAQFATTPGQSIGVAVFNPSFRQALGLNHSQIAGAYMVATLVASLPVFVFGMLMDRYGIRRVMIVAVTCLGGACFFTALANDLAMLFIAFCLLRIPAHGALPLLADSTLAMWFRRHLGTVSGLKNLGTTCTIMAAPTLCLWLIHNWGWRQAYVILGLGVWIFMLPLLLLVFRNRPEDVNQLTDGVDNPRQPDPSDRSAKPDLVAEPSMHLKAACRTRAFWILLAEQGIGGLTWAGIVFHIMTLFQSRNLTDQDAATTFVTLGFAMGLTQFIGGFLANRLPLHLLLATAVAIRTVGLLFLITLHSVPGAHVYAAVFGSGQGLLIVVTTVVWPRYFGRDHLGKIRAGAHTATVAGSSIGPFLMGVAYDRFHSFTPPLMLLLVLSLPLAAALTLAGPPRQARTSKSGPKP